jgi:hypothetical protein
MNDNLIFIHIPKTAGSTLNKIIKSQFPNKSIFKIDASKEDKSIEELRKLDKKERNKIRCVMGHMSFGVHKDLPRSFEYITVLRNPVDRVISLYYFILRKQDHPLHERLVANNMTLEDFINDKTIASSIENLQTRLISGKKTDNITRLHLAQKNLKKYFIAVGITEKFDTSLELFSQKLGWKISDYQSINITQDRPQTSQFPQHIIRAIEEKNAWDMELYEFADRLLVEEFFQQKQSRQKTQAVELEPHNFSLSPNPA